MLDKADMELAIAYVRQVQAATFAVTDTQIAKLGLTARGYEERMRETLAHFRALTDGALTPARYALMRLAGEEGSAS